jgi:hypothetical protein
LRDTRSDIEKKKLSLQAGIALVSTERRYGFEASGWLYKTSSAKQ